MKKRSKQMNEKKQWIREWQHDFQELMIIIFLLSYSYLTMALTYF